MLGPARAAHAAILPNPHTLTPTHPHCLSHPQAHMSAVEAQWLLPLVRSWLNTQISSTHPCIYTSTSTLPTPTQLTCRRRRPWQLPL